MIEANAKKRNIDFRVSKEYLWDLFLKQDGRCALSNRKLSFNKHNKTASLDRIDNDKCYMEGNVHWVYKNLNFMKHTESLDFTIDLCSDVYKNTQRIEEKKVNDYLSDCQKVNRLYDLEYRD